MKISQLIKQLQYELDSVGDVDVYISIATGKDDKFSKCDDIYHSDNLITSLDACDNDNNLEKKDFVFGIRNWLM